MTESPGVIAFEKRHVLVALCFPVLYVIYLCVIALVRVPRLCEMLVDIGLPGRLPGLTLFLLHTYRYWGVVALALVVATVHFAFRPRPTARHAIILLASSSGVALAFHATLLEGYVLPFIEIMKSL